MRFTRLMLAFSVLLLSGRLLNAAETLAPTMIQIKGVTLDPMTDQTRGPMKWSHGAFLFEDAGPGGNPRTFHTLDRDGQLLSSARADIPGSAYVSLGGFDRRDDNSIVFIGQAWSQYGQPVPFIGLISADGTTENVIRTAPYHPYMLSIAPDGTFWTLGFEMVDRDVSAPELNPSAGVLRHFDRSGKLLGSSGPQAQFIKLYTTTRLDYGSIAATNDRIGWYAPRSGSGGQYVEIDSHSMTLHTYPGLPDLPLTSLLVCFSLTESGNAFLAVYDNKSERSTTYMFDRASLKWLPLQERPVSKSPAPYLIGIDGEQLVFRDWHSSATFFNLSR